MALRESWSITYNVASVLDAAKKQLAYHQAEEADWRAIEKESRAQDRDAAASQDITHHEALAEIVSRALTARRAPSARNGRNALDRISYETVRERHAFHHAKVEEFRSWIAWLSNPQLTFVPLDRDDMLFFGLIETNGESEETEAHLASESDPQP